MPFRLCRLLFVVKGRRIRKGDFIDYEAAAQSLGMGALIVFCRRHTVCGRDDNIADYVQASWHVEYRHHSLYLVAVFAVGYQTFLESVRGHNDDQTVVDLSLIHI